jgi:uncharacterized phage infection (PIP) family protein YhgE
MFLVGIIIPVIWQVLFFSIAIPALNKGDTRISNLTIAIVNEDTVMGTQIVGQLSNALPFKTEMPAALDSSLKAMNDGDYNMVIHIGRDFTAQMQQGSAGITYYINQSAPSITKQMMETTAKNINEILNGSAFDAVKNQIQQGAAASLSRSGLPLAALESIDSTLTRAFSSLKYNLITGDIQKVNNADGFIKTTLPLYIFLTFFIGSVAMTITQTIACRSLSMQYKRSRLYIAVFGINVIYSLIIPVIIISFAAGFGIALSQGTLIAWLLFAAGFFAFLSFMQMFANWLGVIGAGIMVLLLFPLQLIASGLMFPREILPVFFYQAAGGYLPATYFGIGITRVFFGDLSISGEAGILMLIAAVCLVISALSLIKKDRNPVKDAGNSR